MRVIVSTLCVGAILVSQTYGQSLGFFGEVHGEGSPGFIPHGDFMAHMPAHHGGLEHPNHARDLAPHHAVPFPPPPHPAPGMFGLSRV